MVLTQFLKGSPLLKEFNKVIIWFVEHGLYAKLLDEINRQPFILKEGERFPRTVNQTSAEINGKVNTLKVRRNTRFIPV